MLCTQLQIVTTASYHNDLVHHKICIYACSPILFVERANVRFSMEFFIRATSCVEVSVWDSRDDFPKALVSLDQQEPASVYEKSSPFADQTASMWLIYANPAQKKFCSRAIHSKKIHSKKIHSKAIPLRSPSPWTVRETTKCSAVIITVGTNCVLQLNDLKQTIEIKRP